MNINQLIQKTTNIESIVKDSSSGNYTINFENGRSVKTEFNHFYEALFSVRSEDESEIFKLCERGDMYSVLPEDRHEDKEFLVWFTTDGSFMQLKLEINAGYSIGVVSSFRVSYYSKEDGYFDGQDVCYVSNQSQHFQQTPKGLQEAVNCFLDRMNSDKPYRASIKWCGISIQGIKALHQQQKQPITSEFLIDSGYIEIGRYVNKPGLLNAYQKKYSDSVGVKYFINIDQYDFREFKDMNLSYQFQWVMKVRIPNSNLGHYIDVNVPINTRGSVFDFVEAQDTVEQLYREIGGYYCELN